MGKVVPPKDQDVLCPIHAYLFVEMVQPLAGIVFCCFYRYKRTTICVVLLVNKRRRNVASQVYMSKNLIYGSVFPIIKPRAHFWSPDELKLLRFFAAFKVLLIYSPDDHCFQAHLCKKFCICSRVAKWVKLPANSWCNAEFIH